MNLLKRLSGQRGRTPARGGAPLRRERLAFDGASRRRLDENGFLHVSGCHISKEAVNEYYGREIPGWRALGLEPERVYKGWRPGSELARAAETFNGLPLLREHVKDSAAEPRKDLRVGNLGTEAAFVAPYLDNSLIIQDAGAIEALSPRDGSPPRRELSASYRYDPLFEPGVFQGERYDFVMTNIRGNHVALVEEGRAGPDVVVSDANTIKRRGDGMTVTERLKNMLGGPRLESLAAELLDGPWPPAGDEEGEEPAPRARLLKLIDDLEDRELAAEMRALLERICAAPAGDEEADEERAADSSLRAGTLKKRLRAELRAQVEAAREVRPLVGELDPLGFDSAAAIYSKALALIGRPSRLKDPQALKELWNMAREARGARRAYPVLEEALAADRKGETHFANLSRIRIG